ncbi:Pentatricopeptide repeat-containing protein [Thalictrum thalictroides]|uniref:Pentatricopeptide repeat-containing protein n=1 Tax=Thalictrum thalictroides TaxID=46969 RepID=A0A7J6W3C1_THATH|nr:Pentatricopeptide repeat-containing protein [Thalictrum thalictroides]
MDAIRAFEKIGDFDLTPGVDDLDQLIFMLCKKKFVKEAQQFFDRVKFDFAPSPKSYTILIRGWGEVGDAVEARKLFDEILQRGCSVDLIAFNTLLESLCRGGKTDEAYKLFKEMGLYGLKPDGSTYSVFIRASCEVNDVHSAVKVLDRMRRYNLAPNVFTYNCIVKLFVKNQMLDDAYLLLDEMIERGVSPDIWSYNAIEAFHCDHCEVHKALKMITRMENDGCMPNRHTYNMALKMLIRVGRFDRATELWESMDQRGYYAPVSTYAVMIHGLCKKKGKVEEACCFFEMMIDEGLPPYPCTCELVRDRLLGLGLLENTQILTNKMLRSTSCSIQELSKIMAGHKNSMEAAEERMKQS